MKKVFAIIAALFLTAGAYAQILTPVKWSYAAKKTGPTTVTVFLKASIADGWHIYSQNVKDGGPIKTAFTFAKSKDYTLAGKPAEPKPVTRFEKAFNMDVSFFEHEVVFQQKIKLKSPKVKVIKGQLEYMTCNDSKCLPPEDVNFVIPLGK
ncbi:protein-disulfide reductase DsbD domain-containing protein [Mucilaginibacter sp. UR6-11]|uniref:protein-disulfide reductase DsbD domain-containing protein n=1 Tax=Mucilaginibacter sp. UR6-11 TaxID=1435644 RepID=UPI001E339C83|nr:protein-disulfide reductase DsbD domain-containing protein [Mucilaginibacter sp. UR6-11]MCC8424426.1 protein-disulfide reductase DsbD N-terminal domain-containing protein [Mucilaginibacter sp. UR6-11]